MMSEAQLRSLEIQRQSIDGRVEEVRAKERLGASAEEVAARTKQDAVGSLDFALSQLSPPSLNEDKRGEIRLAYMRAVDTRAKEIEAKQLDQQERARVEKRSELEQQQRDPSLVLAA
jgi:hypothetical protein